MKQSRHVHHPHDQATTVKVLAIGIVLLMAIAFGAWITDSDAGTQATVDRTWAPLPGEVIAPPAGTTLKDPNPADVDPSATKAMENERAFNAPDGSVVRVAVSSYYAPDQVLDQQYVDFLGSLIHGKELDGIQVMIVGPSEIQEDQYCGGDAVACYDPSIGQVFIVGDPTYEGVPTSFALAHEYGHHIARSRLNPPFSGGALSWGTKRWASNQKICPLAADRKLFPGNPNHYWDDPGEAMAEEYATTQTTSGSPWVYTSMLTPDARSNAAVLSDVEDPWTGPTVTNFAGHIKRGQQATVQFDTPLDGSLRMNLTGPSSADFDLLLYSAQGKLMRISRKRASREKVGFTVCGQRRLIARVVSYRGAGQARLSISRP